MADNQEKFNDLQAALKAAQKQADSYDKKLDSLIDKQIDAIRKRNAADAAGQKKRKKYYNSLQKDYEDEIEALRNIQEFEEQSIKSLEAKAAKLGKEVALQAELEEVEKKRRKDQAEGLRQFEKSFRMIPGIGGAIANAFDKAADIIEEGGSGLKAMGVLGKNFLNILGPAALLGAVIDVNKELGQMHKELGVGRDAALRIRKEFAQIADSSNDARITSTKLVKAQTDLTKQLGFTTQFSGESLQNFINTTEYLGASAESAAKLQVAAAATGQGVDQFTEGLAVAAQESEKTYGIHLPLRNVVESISKMQGATLAYMIDQPKQLVKAVAVADRLGMSFDKIRSIADGLVNFESSITAELEAEVMLGKDINLNKARQLAFLGKEAELGQELLKQVGSLSDFTAMLPVQQEAFAKAMGMSRDEMAGVLMRQEMISQYGDKAAKLSKEQLENAKAIAKEEGISVDAALVKVNSQVDATKKFEDAVLKIKSSIADLVANLSPMIDRLADFVGKFAASPLAKIAVSTLAVTGSIGALFSVAKAFRGVTPAMPLYTANVGLGRSAGLAKGILGTGGAGSTRKALNYFGGARGLKAARVGLGAGAAAGLLGMGVSALASDAARKGKEGLAAGLGATGGALSGAGMGAMIGSMIPIPVVGTVVGAAVGGLYGGITGYLDKQEAAREAKRAQIQKEIDERGAVADELKQIKDLMKNSETGVYIDGMKAGTALTAGASLNYTAYQL